jgi:hypothetical protein
MNTSAGKLVWLALAASLATLVLLIGVPLVTWALGAGSVRPELWALIESLSTALGAALVIGASVFAIGELNEATAARLLDVADRLFDDLNSEEGIAARRWVYQQLPDDPHEGLASLTEEGQRYVKRVLNSLDRIAFMTQQGWIQEEMLMPWMNPMIVKIWDKLGPYVEVERERRNEPDYYEMARDLAMHCIGWRKERYPDWEKPTWLDDAL